MGGRKIKVVPYDPQWPQLFAAEAACLAPAFGELLVGLYHMGSTAISGCHAKPIIYILEVVLKIERVEAGNLAMIALGYELRGENGIAGRRNFAHAERGRDLFHLHTFQRGNLEIDRHLDYGSYLCTHPQAAREYATLKQQLALRFPHDIDGNGAFLGDIDQKALGWRRPSALRPAP